MGKICRKPHREAARPPAGRHMGATIALRADSLRARIPLVPAAAGDIDRRRRLANTTPLAL
jgi:hypothetical protein